MNNNQEHEFEYEYRHGERENATRMGISEIIQRDDLNENEYRRSFDYNYSHGANHNRTQMELNDGPEDDDDNDDVEDENRPSFRYRYQHGEGENRTYMAIRHKKGNGNNPARPRRHSNSGDESSSSSSSDGDDNFKGKKTGSSKLKSKTEPSSTRTEIRRPNSELPSQINRSFPTNPRAPNHRQNSSNVPVSDNTQRQIKGGDLSTRVNVPESDNTENNSNNRPFNITPSKNSTGKNIDNCQTYKCKHSKNLNIDQNKKSEIICDMSESDNYSSPKNSHIQTRRSSKTDMNSQTRSKLDSIPNISSIDLNSQSDSLKQKVINNKPSPSTAKTGSNLDNGQQRQNQDENHTITRPRARIISSNNFTSSSDSSDYDVFYKKSSKDSKSSPLTDSKFANPKTSSSKKNQDQTNTNASINDQNGFKSLNSSNSGRTTPPIPHYTLYIPRSRQNQNNSNQSQSVRIPIGLRRQDTDPGQNQSQRKSSSGINIQQQQHQFCNNQINLNENQNVVFDFEHQDQTGVKTRLSLTLKKGNEDDDNKKE